MERPLVSIIVPAYNNEDTIERSLLSLVNQTYPKKEIIIVYDEVCSSELLKFGGYSYYRRLKHESM